jgi:hypothetical protein
MQDRENFSCFAPFLPKPLLPLPQADEMASTRFQKLARFFRISGMM